MVGAKEEIEIIVRARDLARQTLRNVGTSVLSMARTAARGFALARRAARDFTGATIRGLGRMMESARRILLGLPGLVAGALTGAGALATGALIRAASDAEETQGKFDVVFRGVSEGAEAAAASIASGMQRSTTEVKVFLSTLQDTFVPLGFTRDQGLALSDALARLSIDVASFNNAQDADVLRDFQSALVGQTETVRKYGVVILESNTKQKAYELGLAEVGEELTNQQKILARYALLLEGTADAQGDAIRTSTSFANQVKALRSGVRDLAEEFGQRLIAEIENVSKSLGGTGSILDLVRIGFEFLTAGAILVIDALGRLASRALDIIDNLGGVDEAARVVGDTVSNVASIVVSFAKIGGAAILVFAAGVDTAVTGIRAFFDGVKALSLLVGIGLVNAAAAASDALASLVENSEGFASFITTTLRRVTQVAFDTRIILAGLSGAADEEVFALVRAKGRALAEIREIEEGGGEALATRLRAASDQLRQAGAAFRGDLEGVSGDLERLGDDYAQRIAAIKGLLDGLTDGVSEDLTRALTEGAGLIQELKAALAQGGAEGGREAGQRTAEEIAAGILENQQKLRDALAAALAGGEGAAAGGGNFLGNLIARGIASGVSGAQGFFAGLSGEGEGGFFNGLKAALKDVKQGFNEAGRAQKEFALGQRAVESVFEGFFRGLDSSIQGAVTGAQSIGEAWKKAGQQIIVQLLQITERWLILKALGFFGFGGGGGGGRGGGGGGGGFLDLFFAQGGIGPALVKTLPMKFFAQGGVSNGPTLGVFGENPRFPREAFVPLPDGRSIPVKNMDGGGSGQPVNITFQVQALDARGVDELLMEREEMFRSMISRAIEENRGFRTQVAGA